METKEEIIITKEEKKVAEEMLSFIEKSPSPFHAIENAKSMLQKAGYQELQENGNWEIKPGGKYFTSRNQTALIAFAMPKKEGKGFHMASAHSDSPTFKIKEKPGMAVEEQYIKLNTEKYGGMILSTWLDRPLSVAGRVITMEQGKVVSKLVNLDRDLLVIPNLAIHMNREINSGMEYNPQVDMLPLFAQGKEKEGFMELVAQTAGVKKEEIISHDLVLYVRDKGRFFGKNQEFVLSPKLDDLQCVYAIISAMEKVSPKEYVNMGIIFDNEEVGSGTKQGADSTFLTDVLTRIKENMGWTEGEYLQKLADSFMISADNAHGVHPNHPEKADPTNRPYLNGGIVIKYHGSQRYATDGVSAAICKNLCDQAKVPHQTFANRSDMVGGSTLGNISTAHVSVSTVDIGLPQLAMHSAVETGGTKDTGFGQQLFRTYFAQ